MQDVPAGVVAGRIVDDDEKPVEGLEVKLLRGLSSSKREEIGKINTGAKGEFDFKGLAEDWYVLDVETRHATPEEIKDVLAALPESQHEVALGAMTRSVKSFGRFWVHGDKGINLGNLRWLRRGCMIKTTVVSDNKAKQFNRVYVWNPPQTIRISNRATDETGSVLFPLYELAKGERTFLITESLPMRGCDRIQLLPPWNAWMLLGKTLTVSMQTGTIHGQIKNEKGEGLPDVWLYRYDVIEGSPPWSRVPPIRTDKDGSYRWDLTPVGRFRVATFMEDLPTLSSEVELHENPLMPHASDEEVNFVIPTAACGSIDGQIDFSMAGMKIREIARIQKKTQGKLPSLTFGVYLVPKGKETPLPFRPRATVRFSDEPMRFECKGVQSGSYRILVRPVDDVGSDKLIDLTGWDEKNIPLPEKWAPGGLFGLHVRVQTGEFEVKRGESTKVTIDSEVTDDDLAEAYGAPVSVIRSRLDAMRDQLKKADK